MEPPYEADTPNNFAAENIIAAGEPRIFDFRSFDVMGANADDYRSLNQGNHIYMMGWIRYADDADIVRQTTFCRLYRKADGEPQPRFHVVEHRDYENEY